MSALPELLLLHGWGLNRAIWGSVPRPSGLKCPDLPGHGQDRRSPAPTLESWLDAVLETAPARSVWLGWSFGGLLALAAARRFPDRVRGLILVATTPRFLAAPGWEGLDRDIWDRFATALVTDYAATLQRFLMLQAGVSERATVRALRQALLWQGAPQAPALQSALTVMAASDLRATLRPWTVPTLLLQGTRDRIVPPAAMEWLQPALQAHAVWLPGAGHAPFLSQPDLFWNTVAQFCQEHAWS